VIDKEQLLVGIFSERDYARKVILHGKASRDTRVRDDHERQGAVRDARPDGGRVHGDHDREALPSPAGHSTDDHTLLGIVSIGDVVKETICEQKFIIEQMEKYITG
jgi:CBS domain-containing protein